MFFFQSLNKQMLPWSPLLSRSHSLTLFSSYIDSVTTQTKALVLLQESKLHTLSSNLNDSSESQMLQEAEHVKEYCKTCTIKPVFWKMALCLAFHDLIFLLTHVDLSEWVSLHCVTHFKENWGLCLFYLRHQTVHMAIRTTVPKEIHTKGFNWYCRNTLIY